MALDKVTYVDNENVIYADNLNDIQDAIIAAESDLVDIHAEIDGFDTKYYQIDTAVADAATAKANAAAAVTTANAASATAAQAQSDAAGAVAAAAESAESAEDAATAAQTAAEAAQDSAESAQDAAEAAQDAADAAEAVASSFEFDKTFSQENKFAEAKATGDLVGGVPVYVNNGTRYSVYVGTNEVLTDGYCREIEKDSSWKSLIVISSANYPATVSFLSESIQSKAVNDNLSDIIVPAGGHRQVVEAGNQHKVLEIPDGCTHIVFNTYRNSNRYDPAKTIAITENGFMEVLFNDINALGPDTTLTVSGQAADAKATGDAVAKLTPIPGYLSCEKIIVSNGERKYCFITGTNTLEVADNLYARVITVDPSWEKIFVISNTTKNSYVTFLKDPLPDTLVDGDDISNLLAEGESGRHLISAHNSIGMFTIPVDCRYIFVPTYRDGYMDPASIYATTADTITDCTNAISTQLAENNKAVLGSGLFLISGVNMQNNSTIEGQGSSTIVMLDSDVSSYYAFKMGIKCVIKDCNILGAGSLISLADGDADSIHIGTRHGILYLGTWTGASESNSLNGGIVENCWISRFSGGAITCENTGTPVGYGINVSNCHITNCGAGINVTYRSEFNRFTAVRATACYYGCINQGGNNVFVGCNFSGNQFGFYVNEATGKVVRYDGRTATASNGGHGTVSACIINHSGSGAGYGVWMRGSASGMVFEGCHIGYGKIHVQTSYNTLFVGCKLGSGPLFLYNGSGNGILFLSCIVYWNNAKSRYIVAYVYDENGNIVQEDAYDEDGQLIHVKMVNCYTMSGGMKTLKDIASFSPPDSDSVPDDDE